MMRSRTKKIVAAISVLMVVALLLTSPFFLVIVKNINDDPEKLPVITAYAHGKTIETNPAGTAPSTCPSAPRWATSTPLDVPAGYPLQLSLPTDVSDAQWALLAVYEDADGNQTGEPRVFEPGEALAVTVESSSDPVKQLVGVEIHLAVGEGSEQGLLIWSIKTA